MIADIKNVILDGIISINSACPPISINTLCTPSRKKAMLLLLLHLNSPFYTAFTPTFHLLPFNRTEAFLLFLLLLHDFTFVWWLGLAGIGTARVFLLCYTRSYKQAEVFCDLTVDNTNIMDVTMKIIIMIVFDVASV